MIPSMKQIRHACTYSLERPFWMRDLLSSSCCGREGGCIWIRGSNYLNGQHDSFGTELLSKQKANQHFYFNLTTLRAYFRHLDSLFLLILGFVTVEASRALSSPHPSASLVHQWLCWQIHDQYPSAVSRVPRIDVKKIIRDFSGTLTFQRSRNGYASSSDFDTSL